MTLSKWRAAEHNCFLFSGFIIVPFYSQKKKSRDLLTKIAEGGGTEHKKVRLQVGQPNKRGRSG